MIVHVSAIGSMFADLAPRLGCWVASRKLYMRMSSGIIGSPLSFFDVTPIGRILARFSKDVDEMDTNLPFLISDGVYCFFEVSIQGHENGSIVSYKNFSKNHQIQKKMQFYNVLNTISSNQKQYLANLNEFAQCLFHLLTRLCYDVFSVLFTKFYYLLQTIFSSDINT